MKRAFRKHLPRLLKAAIGVVCLALVACRIPGLGSPAAGEASVKLASLHGIESLVFSGRDPRDGLTRKGPAFDTTIRGHVAFPGKFGVQASSNTVVSSTGLQLRDAGGATVVVGKTDADGNFELSLNGYEPSSAPGVTYQLEATKSLGGNGTGKDAVRFRTFLRWTGTAWKSITRNEIVISALTTALTIESSLDPANVQPIDTIDKVDHGSPLSGDAFKNGGHPDTEINALASAILGYLAGDVDPVHAVTAIKPRIDGITATAEVGQAVRIDGVGFSPLLSGNTVKFASDQVASIFLATPTSLIVAVPPGAITGPVTVATSLGTSAGVPFTVKPSAAGSGAAIANIVPPTAVPGETINIVGTGFSSSPGANVITFGGNKVATPASASATVLTVVVPAGAKNGNVSLVVGGTSRTNEFFFRVSQPTISSILPESGGPNDAITIMGASFGGLGTVRFNGSGGVDAPAVDSWSDTRVVARVPEPQVGKKVSGPLMIVNAAGAASEPFGSFVASTSISDTFATQANFDSSNSSSVVWGPNGIKAVGEDGDLTVNVGQTRTLGASDAPRSLLAANAAAGSQNLTLSSAAGFVPGMEVFLIQLWSTGAGNWETRKITAVNGNTLTLDAPVSKSYLASSSMVQKIPHYNNVVVSGKLTTLSVASSGVTGGFLVFRAKSVVVNSGGSIDVSGLGATGGAGPSAQGGRPNGGNARANGSNGGGAGGAFVSCDRGWGGGGGGYGDGGTSSSPLGGSTKGGQGGSSSGSNGGGGASSEACGSNFAGGGGGGGYGTAGQDGTKETQSSGWQLWGQGGAAGGTPDLSRIFPGAGGGGGGAFAQSDSGTGGNGGGVIFIQTSSLTNNGVIAADGTAALTDGYRAGGGGSGGSIYLNAETMSLNPGSVRANGGSGQMVNCFNNNCSSFATRGGDGGFGRIRLSYSVLNGGNFPNSAAEAASLPAGTPRFGSNVVDSGSLSASGVATSLKYDTRTSAPIFTKAIVAATNRNGSVRDIQFSTSSDGNTWSSWEGNLANVPSRRYIRWRATLSGDASVDSVRFEYSY